MLRKAALLLLLILAAPLARAADEYASLKPLLGTWLADRDCRVYKDKVLVVFKRLPKTVLVEFRDPAKPEASWGKADIVATGEEDHYRVVTTLPGNPVLKALGISTVGGSVNVSTQEEEEDALPNNYITSSSKVSVLTSLLTIRLRAKYKKATFIFNVESPMGKQTCRGSGVKQPAAKK
jgi:HSP20 family molecular chaperone IbpA